MRHFEQRLQNEPPQPACEMDKLAWEYHTLCQLYDESIGYFDGSARPFIMNQSQRHSTMVKRYLVQKFLLDPEVSHLHADEVAFVLRKSIVSSSQPFDKHWKRKKCDKCGSK